MTPPRVSNRNVQSWKLQIRSSHCDCRIYEKEKRKNKKTRVGIGVSGVIIQYSGSNDSSWVSLIKSIVGSTVYTRVAQVLLMEYLNNFLGHCGLLQFNYICGILFGHDFYVFLCIAVFSYKGFSFFFCLFLCYLWNIVHCTHKFWFSVISFGKDPYVWCISLVNFSTFWVSRKRWHIVMRSMWFIGTSSQKICCLIMRYA